MKVLITGCSRGIGRELLEAYLRRQDVEKVWAVTTHPNKLREVQANHRARLMVVATQVSDPSARDDIRTALGIETLDVLINCAGMYPEEPDAFDEINSSTIRNGFEVNTCSAILVTQGALKALQKSASPKMICVSSLMGSIQDNTSGGSYGYRMSKAALNMFSRSFAMDFPKIATIVIHPGWVKTEMGGDHAPTTIEESVSGMMKVIEGLELKQSGHFYDFEGNELPW